MTDDEIRKYNDSFMIINKPVDIPYMTVQDCILVNAYRHMKRAGRHAANGNFDYADGSAEKAIRNFQRAEMLSLPKLIEELLRISVGRKDSER